MAILKPTALGGRVAWLGVVGDRAATLRSGPVEAVALTFEGIAGESHSGLVRASCSRVTDQYPKGTPIRNVRQLSIVSAEEMAAIAAAMDLPALRPEWLGANVVVEGLPDLTLVPPSSRLVFAGGAGLVVDMENAPCQFPAREIEREHPGRARPSAAPRSTGAASRPGSSARGASRSASAFASTCRRSDPIHPSRERSAR